MPGKNGEWKDKEDEEEKKREMCGWHERKQIESNIAVAVSQSNCSEMKWVEKKKTKISEHDVFKSYGWLKCNDYDDDGNV